MLTSRIASRFAKHPLYLQVRDAMAERIAAGEWKPSATIPNEGDLAREFGVSPGTMRKALDLLEVERLLTRRQGRGTFVNDQSSAELAVRYSNIREDNGAHAGNEVEILDITEGIAEATECGRLYVRAHEKVLRIRRLRRRDRKPYMLEDVVMPLSLFPGLSQASVPSHRRPAAGKGRGAHYDWQRFARGRQHFGSEGGRALAGPGSRRTHARGSAGGMARRSMPHCRHALSRGIQVASRVWGFATNVAISGK